jgi:hypothetical protein
MAFTKKIAGWVAGRIKGEQARKDTMRWMEKTGLGQVLDIAGDIALTQGAIKGVSGLKGLMTGQKAASASQVAQAGQAAQQTQAAIAAGPKPAASLITGSASPVPTRAISQAAATPSPAGLGMGATRAAAPMAAPAATAQAPMRAMVAPAATPTAAPAAVRMAAPPVSAGPTQAATNAFQSRQMLERSIPTPQTRDIFQAPSRTGVQAAMPQMARPEPNILQKTLGAVRSGASATMQYGRENAPLIAATAPAVANVIGAKIEQDIEEDKIKREQAARNRLAMLLMPMFQAQMGQAAPSFQPRG